VIVDFAVVSGASVGALLVVHAVTPTCCVEPQ